MELSCMAELRRVAADRPSSERLLPKRADQAVTVRDGVVSRQLGPVGEAAESWFGPMNRRGRRKASPDSHGQAVASLEGKS